MSRIYSVVNGAAPTTGAAPVAVTTGTALKTLIQLSTSASSELRVRQHWIEFDGFVAALPIKYELLKHASGAATVTAYVAADLTKWTNPSQVASLVTLGTANSGYTASGEGTAVTLQAIETHFIPPTSGIYIQFPDGQLPEVAASTFLRQRVTAGTAVNAYSGIVFEE